MLWHKGITEWNISGKEMPGSIMASAVVMPHRDACHGQPPVVHGVGTAATSVESSGSLSITTTRLTQQQYNMLRGFILVCIVILTAGYQYYN